MGKDVLLPITDILAEMRRRLAVSLEPAHLEDENVRQFVHDVNVETAAAGQVSIDSDTQTPDSLETEAAWARGELGFFQLVRSRSGVLAGAVWSLADSHTDAANAALHKAGAEVTLSSDPLHHREASSYIREGSGVDEEQADVDGTLLQLVHEFNLDGQNPHPLETLAVYMDGVEPSDRTMMKRLGFAESADGIAYEGVDDPCTVFVATPDSVRTAIVSRAKKMGISTTPQAPGFKK